MSAGAGDGVFTKQFRNSGEVLVCCEFRPCPPNESGAPAILFLSGSGMDGYLQSRSLIKRKVDMCRQSTVLIAPADSTVKLKIDPIFSSRHTRQGPTANGDPGSVPVVASTDRVDDAGSVKDVADRSYDGKRALSPAFVDRGETPLGIAMRPMR